MDKMSNVECGAFASPVTAGPAQIAANDGYFRIAAATPKIRVADVWGNARAALACIEDAAAQGVGALVLPELCLTGYTCGDLFHDGALLSACREALDWLCTQTREMPLLYTVGLPLAQGHSVYNCIAACCAGRVLGITVKKHLPNYGEFYEQRWFAPAPTGTPDSIEIEGSGSVPFGSGLVYRCVDAGAEDLVIGIEVCEDLWVPAPPSVDMATAGNATVVLNASASDEIIGKADYRRDLVASQSARLYCAYAYADASEGESTTDLVFCGDNIVAENGSVRARTELFSCNMAVADVDLSRLVTERRRSNTWGAAPGAEQRVHIVDFSYAGTFAQRPACDAAADREAATARIAVAVGEAAAGCSAGDARVSATRPSRAPMLSALDVLAPAPRMPFVPADHGDLAARCETILGLQTQGLKTRLAHTDTRRVVIGLSGGLDSTLALLVAVRAFDALELPRTGIAAVSMPGFGTTRRTKSNAQSLAEGLGVDFREIPIGDAVRQHFADIGHDPEVRDVTYENCQARERTQVLMDLSNQLGGFVIGTGDLSELALGWATYNADHMSMYGVNASVPKTLVRHLVAYAAELFGGQIEAVLNDILDTPVSPELLPPTGNGDIAQRTEDLVGPYELHDFFLYHMLRFGFAPDKIFRMACRSFEGAYDRATILSWLRVFYRRFFAQQFKRSCLPDGPKVGSVTLSPRGDWRMPSDASSALWLAALDAIE